MRRKKVVSFFRLHKNRILMVRVDTENLRCVYISLQSVFLVLMAFRMFCRLWIQCISHVQCTVNPKRNNTKSMTHGIFIAFKSSFWPQAITKMYQAVTVHCLYQCALYTSWIFDYKNVPFFEQITSDILLTENSNDWNGNVRLHRKLSAFAAQYLQVILKQFFFKNSLIKQRK